MFFTSKRTHVRVHRERSGRENCQLQQAVESRSYTKAELVIQLRSDEAEYYLDTESPFVAMLHFCEHRLHFEFLYTDPLRVEMPYDRGATAIQIQARNLINTNQYVTAEIVHKMALRLV